MRALTSSIVLGDSQQRFYVEKHLLLSRILVECAGPKLPIRVLALKFSQERQIYSFHDEELCRLAESAVDDVIVVHHSCDCPVEAGEERRYGLAEFVVWAGDTRKQSVIQLVAKSVDERSARDDRLVPVRRKAGDRGHSIIAAGTNKGVHRLVDVHIERHQRSVDIGAPRVAPEHGQVRDWFQKVAAVSDRLQRVLDSGSRQRQGPRELVPVRNDNSEFQRLLRRRRRRRPASGRRHGSGSASSQTQQQNPNRKW